MPYQPKKKNIKVLFMTQYSGKGSPSAQMRAYNYIPLLEKRGFSCNVSPGQGYRYFHNHNALKIVVIGILTTAKRFFDIFRVRNYDIVYLQREVYQTSVFPVFEWIYSKLNKNMVFDFDDAIYLDNRFIPDILGFSKEIIVGNENLKRYALKHSKYNKAKNVTVIPTPIREEDVKLIKDYSKAKKGEKIVVGFLGNVKPHLKNLAMIKPVIKKLGAKHKIEFRIIGSLGNKDIGKMYADVPCTTIAHSVDVLEAAKEIVKFDIGIMPLEDNEWNAGKCAKKLLDYMGVGLATISSPVGMNADLIQDGKNGFSARSEKEWFDKLERLIKDNKLRKKMGFEARQTIIKEYLLAPCADRLAEVLARAAKE